MNEKGKKLNGYLLSLTLLASIFIFSMGIMPSAQAQIVIIGSPSDDLPGDYLSDAKAIAAKLKAKGYTGNKLIELYGKNATSTNILKAMYNADAVIYIGHGGYEYGHYNGNGGTATPPFSLVGYAPSSDSSGNEFIWGVGDNMRQGWSGSLFTAPLKSNSAAFLFHACFSTGDVGGTEVKNSAETIYNFSRMFTGAGASYYASAYYGGDIIKEFLDGATSLSDANSKLDYSGEKLNSAAIPIGGTYIWRSNDHSVAFTGNWAYKFPSASQVSDYNPVAAAAWYAGDKTKLLVSAFTSAQNYIPTEVTFKEYSCDVLDTIVKWTWDFGDGSDPIEFYNTTNQSIIHNYASLGNYNVTHTVTNSKNQVSTATKTISIQNRAPVSGFTVSPSNPAVKGLATFNSTSYDPDYNDSITSWYWNFGDGTSAYGQTVKHAFYKEGYFKVALTTKDTSGKSSATSKTIKVGNPKPDLVITSIKRSGSTRYIKIKNQGTITSSGCYVRIWNGKYSYKRYKQAYVKALSPGASTTVKITRFYYYHGKAKVDYYNKVSEKCETNNVKSI
jgi:PKD repeat protein